MIVPVLLVLISAALLSVWLTALSLREPNTGPIGMSRYDLCSHSQLFLSQDYLDQRVREVQLGSRVHLDPNVLPALWASLDHQARQVLQAQQVLKDHQEQRLRAPGAPAPGLP